MSKATSARKTGKKIGNSNGNVSATSTVKGALSFSDITSAGNVRTMHIVLANGLEGDLYYKALSVRDARKYKSEAAKLDINDPEGNIKHAQDFLADLLVNHDGSKFATSSDLENVAIDDLMIMYNLIIDSMAGERRRRQGSQLGNVSETTTN